MKVYIDTELAIYKFLKITQIVENVYDIYEDEFCNRKSQKSRTKKIRYEDGLQAKKYFLLF